MKEKKQIKKGDSLVAVAHHIKGPTSVLKGYLEALLSGDLGEISKEQKKYIKICLKNTNKLNFIIEGLVRVIEIEDEKYKMEKEPVDIVQEIEGAIEDNFLIAKASNAKISFKKTEDSILVLTDKVKMRGVLNSFLENAIKYRKGRVGLIEVGVEKRGDEALCFIKDNGFGISEEEKEKIFKKFYRTRDAIKVDPNSLGLGLYVNKTIINFSGGEVWVEKNSDGGATFYFTLPIYFAEE